MHDIALSQTRSGHAVQSDARTDMLTNRQIGHICRRAFGQGIILAVLTVVFRFSQYAFSHNVLILIHHIQETTKICSHVYQIALDISYEALYRTI